MGRPTLKEVERVEGLGDLDDPTDFEADLNRVEAAEGFAAARGFALAILVSVAIWLLIVGAIALAVIG